MKIVTGRWDYGDYKGGIEAGGWRAKITLNAQ